MRVIGLTGGIAGGKSTVSAYLSKKGIEIIDADKISHEICSEGSECLKRIKEEFGEGVFEGESLDRKALAAVVFSDKEKLKQLEEITHPIIIEETKKRLAKCGGIAVIDAPLLYAANMDKLCTEVWSVSADEEKRIRRIMERDNATRAQAVERIKNQMPQQELDRRADFVIKNDGSKEDLILKVEALLDV